jgi:hypothetical protein
MIDPTTGRHLLTGQRIAGGPLPSSVMSRPDGMASATTTVSGPQMSQPWHPSSPIFALMAIAAAALGLYGVSTNVRVGPAKASASVGKP